MNKLHLSKPKKSENSTFVCPSYYNSKEQAFDVELENVYVISLSTNTIVIKAPKFVYDFFSSVSNKIISTVKDKRTAWFSTSMPDELIDEYYSHPIIYDEKYGDLLRLKTCPHVFDLSKVSLKKRCDIILTLDGIRIHKQKFFPEWKINNICEDDDHSIVDDDNDEDIEDIKAAIPYESIRTEYLKSLSDLIESLQAHLHIAEGLKDEISKSSDKQLIGLCERVDDMMCPDDQE